MAFREMFESRKGLLGEEGTNAGIKQKIGGESYCLRRATCAVASQQRKGVASHWELPLLWQIMSRLKTPGTCYRYLFSSKKID